MNKRLELLECFRGIATILIVGFHATVLFELKFNRVFLLSIFEFGDAGVDFFFVLSGFFLALVGLKYTGSKDSRDVKGFLLRRFIRIYPLYWLINLFLIPIYFLAPSFGKGYERNIGAIAKSLLLIPQAHFPILTVAWFLTHLVFFYLVFSLLVLMKSRLSIATISIWLVLSVAFSICDLLSGSQLSQNSHYLVSFFFSYYILEFFAGFLVGVLALKIKISNKIAKLILMSGLCLFLAAGGIETYILPNSAEIDTASYYNLFTYGVASVLIVGGSALLEKDREKDKKVNVPNFFLSLGAASYTIYLIHYPLLSLFTKVVQATLRSNFVFLTACMIFACCLSIAFGYAVHIFVEKKLISSLRSYLSV